MKFSFKTVHLHAELDLTTQLRQKNFHGSWLGAM